MSHPVRFLVPIDAYRPTRFAGVSLVLAALLVALSACGTSGPEAPAWQFEARSSLDRATTAYLEGRARVEAAEMARARAALARSGRADLLADAELTLCAAHVASLVFEPCAGFEALRADATPAQLAYAAYLTGRATAADIALLPEAQRATAHGSNALAAQGEPLPQLVAAGALLQAGRATPAVVGLAIELASRQGWRRPLLAWLGVQLKLAEQSAGIGTTNGAGAGDAAAQIRRRIALIESSLPATATSSPAAPSTLPASPTSPVPSIRTP